MPRKHYKLTIRSGNAKTGRIAVTMSPKSDCPTRCPFRNGNGCYAENFPMALHWDRLSAGRIGVPWNQFLLDLAKVPEDMPIRLWVAGDLPGNGRELDHAKCKALADTLAGHTAPVFGYTRYDMNLPQNAETVQYMLGKGIVINASCTPEETAANRLRNIPCTVVLPVGDAFQKAFEQRYILCPAQREKTMTCEQCMICANAKRKMPVAFEAHGTRKHLASKACA